MIKFGNKKMKAKINSATAIIIALAPNLVYAAGGLAAATTEANSIKTWLWGFLGVCVFIYMMYNVFMALMDRQTWADVGMALAKCAGAGGSLAAVTWAWGIFA